MAKSNAAIDDAATPVDDKPTVVSSKRRPSKAVKIAAIAAGGVAVFAGGILVAQQFGGGDSAADAAQDSFATQQLVASLNQGDAIIKDAQGATDPTVLQSKGVELQTLAVAMEPLASQFSDEDLREATEKLTEGYLDISIGLVTNSGAKTNEGAQTLNEGREMLVEVLGGGQQDQQNQDQQPPAGDQQPPAEGQQDSGN